MEKRLRALKANLKKQFLTLQQLGLMIISIKILFLLLGLMEIFMCGIKIK
jgi:hypothetical protein